MGPLALLDHLLNFVAPALVVGVLLATIAPWVLRAGRSRHGWLLQAALNTLAGSLALLGGLWFFGNDGKMASYLAMTALCATSQWLFMQPGKSG